MITSHSYYFNIMVNLVETLLLFHPFKHNFLALVLVLTYLTYVLAQAQALVLTSVLALVLACALALVPTYVLTYFPSMHTCVSYNQFLCILLYTFSLFSSVGKKLGNGCCPPHQMFALRIQTKHLLSHGHRHHHHHHHRHHHQFFPPAPEATHRQIIGFFGFNVTFFPEGKIFS